MNFLEALATGRPIRRAAWIKHPPVSEKDEVAFRMIADGFWIHLRTVVLSDVESRWLRLHDGKLCNVARVDYLATDWEIQP